ncbi:MAGE family-domain-containing protein [Lasiosphaeria miniovina]|uniref:MAGE family-domain-containing protein n=1 Tax=Lasiosphaeria miniovina TaxID=1954250 RepID=A0AA40BG97_9PEZI|nr:MAGE family-domain-containing protein [Lasiosphaeria miniovina]KAK0733697.1 MAGE family-domain-containing protein [Lasiosphaeria miniovina]
MPPQRRRRAAVPDDEDEEMPMQAESPDGGDSDGGDPMEGIERAESSQLIKKLVRYALACEYSRTPIRRDGIKEKVLGPQGREFKKVFAGAQKQLRAAFGMEMIELPARDRNLLTADQKRKAAKSQNHKEPSSNSYMLVSVLPEDYRAPAIIAPSKVQSADGEASYVGLYSLIIAIITLSGGELSDPRFRRHLARLNATENMPSLNPNNENAPNEKTEVVLQRMIRQGYLVRVTEARTQDDEDSTTWHVGPRGKKEVDGESVASLVRTIYGGSTDELEKKLQASLKVKDRKTNVAAVIEDEEVPQVAPAAAGPSSRRRSRRRPASEEDDNE